MRLILLAIVSLVFACRAQAAPCGDLFADSATYTEGLAAAECTLRETFDLGVSGTRKTYKTYDASGSAYAGREWHVRIARETIERAAPFYGRLAQMTSATVIFGGGAPRVGAGDGGRRSVLAETVPKIFGDVCVLSVTDTTLGVGYGTPRGEEELKLTIAHELFHCVQQKNWPRKVQDAMAGDAAWWTEGTAEYIQHEVFPEYAMMPSRAEDFDAQIGREGLLGAQHANGVFFAFYAEAAGGPAGVISLIERMASVPGRATQVSALSGVPGFADLFQTFAKRYLDRDLRSPGGHVISVNPRAGETVRITALGERDFRVKPFAIQPVRLVFPAGENWMIEAPSGGGDVRFALRYDEARDTWSPAPFEVLACARERTVLLAATATPSPEEIKTLRLKFEDRRGNSEGCPCPLGAWTIAPADINAKFPLSAMGAALPSDESNKGWRFRYVSGSPMLSFNRDGNSWYSAVLTFETDEKPVKVPAACTSDACARRCLAGHGDATFCNPTRASHVKWRVVDKTTMTWTWRRRDATLIRTTSGGEGQYDIYYYDGFNWRFVNTKVKRVGSGSTSGNPFRCVGSELYLDPTPAGRAEGIDDLIAQLEAGNEQQRAAAAQLRAMRDRPGGDAIARQMMDRMARGEASGVTAYPFSGRFVR